MSETVAAVSSADVIRAAVAGKLGLMSVSVAERRYPLWLRAGTDDAAACVASLNTRAGRLRIPYNAKRILLIGAGSGYRAVALAEAFAEARIIAAESDAALRKICTLNTMAYRNITPVFAAVSAAPMRLGVSRDDGSGREVLKPSDAGSMASLALGDLLKSQGWSHYDTVIITPDEVSGSLLRAKFPAWVRLIAIRNGGQALDEDVTACFPQDEYMMRLEGEFVLLFRREVEASVQAAKYAIFDPAGPVAGFVKENVSPEHWGFFMIGADGFRLHPNNGGQPAARLIVKQELRFFTKLHYVARLAHAMAQPVRFSVSIVDDAKGEELFRTETVVNGGAREDVSVELPPISGLCRVVFATEMAAAGGENGFGWAEFLGASFA